MPAAEALPRRLLRPRSRQTREGYTPHYRQRTREDQRDSLPTLHSLARQENANNPTPPQPKPHVRVLPRTWDTSASLPGCCCRSSDSIYSAREPLSMLAATLSNRRISLSDSISPVGRLLHQQLLSRCSRKGQWSRLGRCERSR